VTKSATFAVEPILVTMLSSDSAELMPFKVRELAYEGVLQVCKVATDENTADVLTKVLDVSSHWKHVTRLLNLTGSEARSVGVT